MSWYLAWGLSQLSLGDTSHQNLESCNHAASLTHSQYQFLLQSKYYLQYTVLRHKFSVYYVFKKYL